MANRFEVRVPSALEALLSYDKGFDTSRQMERDAALSEAAPDIASGNYSGALARLLQGGNLQGALAVAGLNRDQRDFDFRTADTQRQQRNVDRNFGLQREQFTATQEGARVPPGFRKTASGGLEHIPKGPADPDYIRSLNEAKEKPREFGYADVSKLAEEGGKFASVNGFIENFRPEYAGKPFGMGSASNFLARNLPSELTGETERNAASYWQNYDRYKNVVRNDLFGSALTATEQAAFEKADVNPGMNPELIKRNLAEQQKVLQGAMRRKAGALVASKYKPEAISEAYGIPLKELGVSVAGASRSAPTAPAAIPPMPAGLPPGSQYSPSRNQWRTPDGQIVNAGR